MSIATPDTKRRALGKGLDSLLPRVQTPGPALASHEAESGKPREIAVELIDRNPFQTRSQVHESELEELAASIVANGVVQPILVRPQPNGRFQLIAGERRWRASQMAKKATIPAILRQVSDEQAMEITIVENLQREDLNPMDQARAFETAGDRIPHDPGADRDPHRQGPGVSGQLHAPAEAAAQPPGAGRVGRTDIWPRAGAAGIAGSPGSRKACQEGR